MQVKTGPNVVTVAQIYETTYDDVYVKRPHDQNVKVVATALPCGQLSWIWAYIVIYYTFGGCRCF